MSKKISYPKKAAGGKVVKSRTERAAKSRSSHRTVVHGSSVQATTLVGASKDLDVSVKTNIVSFHFLPVLKKERPTYKYNQIKPLLNFLGYNQGDSSELLETNASTLSRWKNSDKPVDIGKLRSKIVLDIDEIISKGVRVFGNEQLFQDWLNTSNSSLGDVKPVDLLKDIYSIELVEDAIDALSWGSYV
ncbi:antitoxin Xre/MbcA/ParS toxin-binding domain-containing protein [Spongiimicrobium sp. 2-473A-2-J]|uniref:antitoxin Xre/MbcA/ParS toxin-binding domain-containing protein n=1 Tax=Eudoraea algarum TaxID=3417568 RepID=UPI003D3698B2